MTPQEFKAWFEGFTEAVAGCPTKTQWARIKERVSEIDGKPVTERIYLDRYWPTYVQQYPPYRVWSNVTCTAGTVGVGIGQSGNTVLSDASFNSGVAMRALGSADAQSLSAT